MLWVLFCVLGASQAYGPEDFELTEFREVCTGRDQIFPYFSDLMRTRQVFFTPESAPGSTRMVIDEGKFLEPRFTYQMGAYLKLLDVSMDYAGKYSVILPGTNKAVNLLTLSVYDCSKQRQVEYGGSYSLDVSKPVEQIDYSPFNDSKTVILWSRTKAIERTGWTLNKRSVEKRLTQTDQGFYTQRNIIGDFLERYAVSIKEIQQNLTFNTGEDFNISFPLDGVHFNLTYQPEHGSSMPVTLIHNGYLVNSETFDGRIKLLSTGVNIRELEFQDTGTFKLQDSDGNVAVVVKLVVVEVEPQSLAVFNHAADFGINIVVIMGAVVVVIVFLLICAKICCCKNNSTTAVSQIFQHAPMTTDQRQPYAMTYNQSPYPPLTTAYAGTQPQATYIHKPPETTTTNDQRQPYPMAFNQSPYNYPTPLASASNQQPQASDIHRPPFGNNGVAGVGGGLGQPSATPANVGPIHFQSNNVVAGGGDFGPSSAFATPADVGPIHFQGSAAGVDPPSMNLGFDCLSSDSGPQFEVPKGLNYPSAPLLSSDTPSVYTSDKHNFL